MRSSTGPESLPRYRSTWSGKQVHSRSASPQRPHGHGFIAATRTKRAGYVAAPPAREIVIERSSSGSRRVSSTLRENSATSSKNKAPQCARGASMFPDRDRADGRARAPHIRGHAPSNDRESANKESGQTGGEALTN